MMLVSPLTAEATGSAEVEVNSLAMIAKIAKIKIDLIDAMMSCDSRTDT
jgi:hypothetical protein